MGLISALFTWPVAPVRGVAWVAEQVLAEAEREWTDPAAVHAALRAVDEQRASGEITEEEAAELEEGLVARLVMRGQGGSDG